MQLIFQTDILFKNSELKIFTKVLFIAKIAAAIEKKITLANSKPIIVTRLHFLYHVTKALIRAYKRPVRPLSCQNKIRHQISHNYYNKEIVVKMVVLLYILCCLNFVFARNEVAPSIQNKADNPTDRDGKCKLKDCVSFDMIQ